MQGSGWMPGKTEAPSSSHFQECPPGSLGTRWLHPRIPGSAWLPRLQRHRWTRTLQPAPPSLHLTSCQGRGQKAKAFLPHKQGKSTKRLIFFWFFFRGTGFLLHLQNYFQRVRLNLFFPFKQDRIFIVIFRDFPLLSRPPPPPRKSAA